MADDPFGPTQHQYLPDTAATGDGTGQLRRVLAARAGVTPDQVYVGTDGDGVIGRILQALLRVGDRVAVSLPAAAEHLRQTLAVGAAYVDVGCDFYFVPRDDRLQRLLEDEAVTAVVASRPNPLTGVDWVPDATGSSVWHVDDQRWAPNPDFTALGGPRCVAVLSAGPVIWAVGPEALIQRLRRLQPEPQLSQATADEVQAGIGAPSPTEPPDWSAVQPLGLIASKSTHPWALVRRPGTDAAELAHLLDDAGVSPGSDGGGHHTWRDGIRLVWPGHDGISRLAATMATAMVIAGLAAGCGGDKAATPANKIAAAPTTTAPAPVASRPAPKASPKKTAEAPPPGVAKDLHRTPVVGGCGTLCTDARSAVAGFAAALVATNRATRLPLYIDSSQLVLDGDAVGERLGQMWLRGQLSPRLQALGKVIDDLGAAAEGADEAALLAAAEQAAFKEQLPRKAVMELALPPKNATWTITVGRRGLEWLVTGINTR